MTNNSLEISISEYAGAAGHGGTVEARAKEAFETLGTLLSDAVAPLRKQLIDASDAADEVELRLDLALRSGGNWVILSMEGSATLSVKLLWRQASRSGILNV